MKYLLLFLLPSLSWAQVSYPKAQAYSVTNGGPSELRFGRDIVLVRENNVVTLRKWAIPGVPQPPDSYWGSLTDEEARAILATAKEAAKPDALKQAENLVIEKLRADGAIAPDATQATDGEFQQALAALLAQPANPATNDKINRYVALKANLELAGGDIALVRYHEGGP